MKKAFLIFMITYSAYAADQSLKETNDVHLFKYENGLATIRVYVCPATAPIEVEIKLTPSSSPNELVFADLQVFTPNEQCYDHSYRDVEVNLTNLIKSQAQLKGIHSESILMKSLPLKLEIQD